MMSHQSKLQVVSSRKERWGGATHAVNVLLLSPPHLSFLMLRRVVSRLFFFPCLAPSLPGAVICLWGDEASKHWVL